MLVYSHQYYALTLNNIYLTISTDMLFLNDILYTIKQPQSN